MAYDRCRSHAGLSDKVTEKTANNIPFSADCADDSVPSRGSKIDAKLGQRKVPTGKNHTWLGKPSLGHASDFTLPAAAGIVRVIVEPRCNPSAPFRSSL